MNNVLSVVSVPVTHRGPLSCHWGFSTSPRELRRARRSRKRLLLSPPSSQFLERAFLPRGSSCRRKMETLQRRQGLAFLAVVVVRFQRGEYGMLMTHGGLGWVTPLRSKHGSTTTLDWKIGRDSQNHHLPAGKSSPRTLLWHTRSPPTAVAADQPTPALKQTEHKKSEPPFA